MPLLTPQLVGSLGNSALLSLFLAPFLLFLFLGLTLFLILEMILLTNFLLSLSSFFLSSLPQYLGFLIGSLEVGPSNRWCA